MGAVHHIHYPDAGAGIEFCGSLCNGVGRLAVTVSQIARQDKDGGDVVGGISHFLFTSLGPEALSLGLSFFHISTLPGTEQKPFPKSEV
jgi:hypothetical protein